MSGEEEPRKIELDEEVPVIGVQTEGGEIEELDEELHEAQAQQIKEDLPEKFQGKSIEDVVEMYSNLESELGRKGQELGDLRKMADLLLQKDLQSANNQPTSERESKNDVVDFFEDPEKAAENLLEQKLAPIKKRFEDIDKEKFMSTLTSKYGDVEGIVKNPKFLEFVQASPMRMKMLQLGNQYDLDAATELFDMWEMVNGKANSQPSDTGDKLDRDEALSAASTETKSTQDKGKKKKVYRRVDLIRLNTYEPEKYKALLPEIQQAYAEGRVK